MRKNMHPKSQARMTEIYFPSREGYFDLKALGQGLKLCYNLNIRQVHVLKAWSLIQAVLRDCLEVLRAVGFSLYEWLDSLMNAQCGQTIDRFSLNSERWGLVSGSGSLGGAFMGYSPFSITFLCLLTTMLKTNACVLSPLWHGVVPHQGPS